MKLALTVYKDGNGIYPDGCIGLIDASSMIGERGYISLVNPNDIKIDFNRPNKEVTQLHTPASEIVYVSETKAEILAKLSSASTGGGAPIEFTIGDGGTYTPLAGTNAYTNPNIVGKLLVFSKNGSGFITNGSGAGQYLRNGADGLGDTLTRQGGDVFGDGEIYVILFQ